MAPRQPQGQKAPNLFPGGAPCGRDGRINFGGGIFDYKPEVMVPFLGVKSDRWANNPIPFFPQMYPITILIYGQGLCNRNSGVGTAPQGQGTNVRNGGIYGF